MSPGSVQRLAWRPARSPLALPRWQGDGLFQDS
jgi:hypothetical protein